MEGIKLISIQQYTQNYIEFVYKYIFFKNKWGSPPILNITPPLYASENHLNVQHPFKIQIGKSNKKNTVRSFKRLVNKKKRFDPVAMFPF